MSADQHVVSDPSEFEAALGTHAWTGVAFYALTAELAARVYDGTAVVEDGERFLSVVNGPPHCRVCGGKFGQVDEVCRGPAAEVSRPLGRNAPCPCGSGRKVKRCDCEAVTHD